MAKRIKRSSKLNYVHRIAAATCLVGFLVIILGGIFQGVRTSTMIWRSLWVILAVIAISRVIIKVIATYEEMNGDNEAQKNSN